MQNTPEEVIKDLKRLIKNELVPGKRSIIALSVIIETAKNNPTKYRCLEKWIRKQNPKSGRFTRPIIRHMDIELYRPGCGAGREPIYRRIEDENHVCAT